MRDFRKFFLVLFLCIFSLTHFACSEGVVDEEQLDDVTDSSEVTPDVSPTDSDGDTNAGTDDINVDTSENTDESSTADDSSDDSVDETTEDEISDDSTDTGDDTTTLEGRAALAISVSDREFNFSNNNKDLTVDYTIQNNTNQDLNFILEFYVKPLRGILIGDMSLRKSVTPLSWISCVDNTSGCNIVNDDYEGFSVEVAAGESSSGTILINASLIGDAIAQLIIDQPEGSQDLKKLFFGANLKYDDGQQLQFLDRSNRIILKNSAE